MYFLIIELNTVFLLIVIVIGKVHSNRRLRTDRLAKICSDGHREVSNSNFFFSVINELKKYILIIFEKKYTSDDIYQTPRRGAIFGKVFFVKIISILIFILSFSVFFGLGYISHKIWQFSFVISVVLGIITPDLIISYKKKLYLSGVDSGLADALDLFLICADAGLGMETSMERVAKEMTYLNRKTASEFLLTVDEMKVNPNHAVVLTGLGMRTGLPAMLRLSSALIQTLETGASLRSVVKVLVAEIREENLIRFETQAARLSVLLTIPMIIFLLPCVFIVIAGPAVIKIIDVLGR